MRGVDLKRAGLLLLSRELESPSARGFVIDFSESQGGESNHCLWLVRRSARMRFPSAIVEATMVRNGEISGRAK